MSLEDEIDGPTALMKAASRPWPTLRARHLVYLQLLAVILSVLFGQCERRGYPVILEALDSIFGLIVLALLGTAPVLPVEMLRALRGAKPRGITTWMAVPPSVAMSLTQILALLPLFQ